MIIVLKLWLAYFASFFMALLVTRDAWAACFVMVAVTVVMLVAIGTTFVVGWIF